MKKVLLLVAFISCLFAGCQKNNTDTPDTPKSDPKGYVQIKLNTEEFTSSHISVKVSKDGQLVKTLTYADSTFLEEKINVDKTTTYSTELIYDTDWENTEKIDLSLYLDLKIIVIDGAEELSGAVVKRSGTILGGLKPGNLQSALSAIKPFIDKTWELSKTGVVTK